jgi:hypothetical protein
VKPALSLASHARVCCSEQDGTGPVGLDTAFVHLLSSVVRVISDCPDVLDFLPCLYHVTSRVKSANVPEPVATFVVESRSIDQRYVYRITQAGDQVGECASVEDAAVHLEFLINTAAAMGLAKNLLLHAGAVASSGRGFVIPGASGAGKSTLVASLCLSGFDYFSDEIAVVDTETAVLRPFLKSVCLKPGGWDALRAVYPLPPPALIGTRVDGEAVRYLTTPGPHDPERRVPIRHIILPRRQIGARARLSPVSRALTLTELARHALNVAEHGFPGVELLARLVEEAECHTLTYDDLPEAVAAVSALVTKQ